MKLHAITLGQGPPMVILHGLLGSGRNWLSIGKILAESYQVFLLDLRNHGQSPHSPIWNYEAMSDDLFHFLEHNHLNQITLMGHSMGGKVAMTFAQRYPNKITQLIIVDIGPGAYPNTQKELLTSLIELDLSTLSSRKQADNILEPSIPEHSTRQFLLTNLYRTEDNQFAWRCNLQVILKNLNQIGHSLNERPIYFDTAPTLFIKGEQSNYINSEQESLIQASFPKAEISTIPQAGHWIHVDQPLQFIECLKRFLNNYLS